MEPRSAPPLAFDGNGDREYLMGLSITDLISNLRTAFRMADYDHVEEVLVEKEAKLKAEIKALTEKLELETLVRMNVEDELKKCKEQCEERKNAEERYERLLESVKKNNDLDLENTVAELRIKNAKLEAENRRAESVVESWKRKFEEFCERLLIVEKGTNSFVDGDTLVGTRGKAEELSGIRGNTDPVVSDKVTGEKDGVDICDNERGNTNAVTGQSSESPNNAVLGASGVCIEDMDKQEKNRVDMHNNESGNTASDTSPSQRKKDKDDCGNNHLTADDSAGQSPHTPKSANASSGSQKVVIEIEDSDDDDNNYYCMISGSLNRKEATHGIAAAVDNGRSSLSVPLKPKSSASPVGVNDMIRSLKRKWFPEPGNSSDRLNKNPVDGSDSDDGSSSSTSSSESGINKVQLPSNFLCSTADKRRKT
ncbi:uncharacterized protein LOC129303243 isoform X1 [Prosopis cineraria]|uniref:uncharacterized protein LOC129303243 isoform X1 n=1 Tax=Prosopis cineraria TaxID=364024 RepID=UPI00240F3DD2|nr:uncharacterized protein LOC129303243 isoform X1 [Prosopis cineraria]XP_054798398.1 uncharacterized protein LOC129303243 isoform X1 [Prosopis cineraria]XP_054798399.1 uncharacterized protein LOC129303243 isoform X1 [Prosopis cineraria]XP_054798400.1 uncharacterized protein LOC129303243 isoform X1 [Prosopis cineraria]XP_054798401.1 uncharacterized protein LOC129303243 isoform X1 [Prosopis cineraria]XP_054798402.1 uncharacterized protein LOC129303243 isoform X1 [Prosopis cineraria]XP_05479840